MRARLIAVTRSTAGDRYCLVEFDVRRPIGSVGRGFARGYFWGERGEALYSTSRPAAVASASGHDYFNEPQPHLFNDWTSLFFLTAGSESEDVDGTGFSSSPKNHPSLPSS